MHIKTVTLTNFRNYEQASVNLGSERNILLGENAQGKSNFLEAIELIATGTSARASHDNDLIKSGANHMHLALTFCSAGIDETLSIAFQQSRASNGQLLAKAAQKVGQINGVSYSSLRKLKGRLSVVSFKSEDLGLLRAGPKFRRDWLDHIALTLKPPLHDKFSRYHKVVLQRNRLLKSIAEEPRSTAKELDTLKIWDEQIAQYGSAIAKERLLLLDKLLPEAYAYQRLISNDKEALSIAYHLKMAQAPDQGEEQTFKEYLQLGTGPIMDEQALLVTIRQSLKNNRSEEIIRRQTLFGPHRDDILFFLNNSPATAFASQGQQRSLVLALKLAELKLVTETLQEPPVLLLDDVLAELDLSRQTLLMSSVKADMQTIISTTHLAGYQSEWFNQAKFINVVDGMLEPDRPIG